MTTDEENSDGNSTPIMLKVVQPDDQDTLAQPKSDSAIPIPQKSKKSKHSKKERKQSVSFSKSGKTNKSIKKSKSKRDKRGKKF